MHWSYVFSALTHWCNNGRCQPLNYYWDCYSGVPSLSQVTATHMKIRHSKMKSAGVQSSNGLRRPWAPIQYPIRCLIVRSHKVSKPWDSYLEYNCIEIWQAPQQQCCWSARQISKWCDNLNYQSCGFEASHDLMIGRLFGYWNRAHDSWYIISISAPVIAAMWYTYGIVIICPVTTQIWLNIFQSV